MKNEPLFLCKNIHTKPEIFALFFFFFAKENIWSFPLLTTALVLISKN